MAGPALDDLLGQMNQHQLDPAVLKLAKRSQQPKVEQGQERAGGLRRSRGGVSRVFPVCDRAMQIERDIERLRDLYHALAAVIELIPTRCRRRQRGIEHVGKVALRQPDREPPRFHKPVDLRV